MLGIDQLVGSMRHEIDVIRHLATKIPDGTMDWRLSENQRSTEELLRYLTVCAEQPALWIRNGNWDHNEEINRRAEELDLADFDAAMARQADTLEELARSFTDEEMRERDSAMPWGTPCKTGEGWVNMVLKCLSVYRMQLFLHAKASGNSALGPMNCWVGMDPPAPAAGG